MNRRNMAILANEPDTGIKLSGIDKNPCTTCIKGKQQRKSFKPSRTRAVDKLELIHTDLCGSMEETSIGGAKYMLTFVDDHTKKVFIYFLEYKNQTTKFFKIFKAMIENQTGQKIKCILSDRGKEYVNDDLKNTLQEAGIRH